MRLSRWLTVALLGCAGAGTACFRQAAIPGEPPAGPAAGRCHGSLDRRRACGGWEEAVAGCGAGADSHVSFPELDPASCYVPVHHPEQGLARADPIPAGCGYPRDRRRVAAQLERAAQRYDRIAAAPAATGDLPLPLGCELPAAIRRAAARQNARTLRATARRLPSRRYPYAAAATFGFGNPVQSLSALVPWLPGQPCLELSKHELYLLGRLNRVRAARVAAAHLGGVAPVVIVSGGAVHGALYEAFMLLHLVACQLGARADAVLVDPCADHTHTNLRHTGALVVALGGRTAYLVTDDGLQGGYLQEHTAFDVVGQSLDARSLRDWGYLLGAWRQASVGIRAGFWYTPYRFWAEPQGRGGLGGFTCLK